MHYQHCENCGKRVKNFAFFRNKPYGIDCWETIAAKFIEKRDTILDQMTYENQTTMKPKLDKLCKAYGIS